MKKIILLLLIILTTLNFSKNIDRYESKKVFEKIADCILTTKCKKYSSDKSMERFLNTFDSSKKIFIKVNDYSKDNKYEIIDVKESNGSSILKIRATYNSYEKITVQEYLKFLEENNVSIETFMNLQEEEFYLLDKMWATFEAELKIEELEVYMNKENGLWNISNDFENIKFTSTLLPFSNKFLEYLLVYNKYD